MHCFAMGLGALRRTPTHTAAAVHAGLGPEAPRDPERISPSKRKRLMVAVRRWRTGMSGSGRKRRIT